MSQRLLSLGGSLLLALAAVAWTASPASAQHGGHGGGGHGGGGFHAGGGGFHAAGGFHGSVGAYRGGYGGYRGAYYRGGYGGYRGLYGGYYRNRYPFYGYGFGYPYFYGGSYWPNYYGYSYPDYGYLYSGSNYYGPDYSGYAPDYGYTPDVTSPAYGAPSTALQPPPATNVGNTAPAIVRVHVPANAELWFDGVKTTQTGADRVFESPPLTAGKAYTYDIKARWMQDGKEVVQTRSINVQPGQPVAVDFTQAS